MSSETDAYAKLHYESVSQSPVKPRNHTQLFTPLPQKGFARLPSSEPRVSCCASLASTSPSSVTSQSPSAGSEDNITHPASAPKLSALRRVTVRLPFSLECAENTVQFTSRGHRAGISLAEWARLSERRKTYLGIEDPHQTVDELCSSHGCNRVLFQSQWPGYDAHTRLLDMPAHVAEGDRTFTRVNLLDMVCEALVEWVVKIMNDRHVECREPNWAIGLQQITFKHIYVVSVIEVKGYVSKWVPVLEIDPLAFRSQH